MDKIISSVFLLLGINTDEIISSIQEELNTQISDDISYYLINSFRDNIEIDINSVAIENILSRFQ